jgi:hypothetical protein
MNTIHYLSNIIFSYIGHIQHHAMFTPTTTLCGLTIAQPSSNQGEHFIMLQGTGLIVILDYQIALDF